VAQLIKSRLHACTSALLRRREDAEAFNRGTSAFKPQHVMVHLPVLEAAPPTLRS